MTERAKSDPQGFIERVEALREGLGIGVYELGERIGKGASYWSVWMSRHRSTGGFPKGDILAVLADELGTTQDVLLGRTRSVEKPSWLRESASHLLMRLGAERVTRRSRELEQTGSAGRGKGVIQGEDETRPRSKQQQEPEVLLVRVEGDCLFPDVLPGDRVEVEPGGEYLPGDLVVAVVDGEHVLVKHYDEVDNVQYLLPLNGEPILLTPNMRIVGVVTDTRRRPKKHRMRRS